MKFVTPEISWHDRDPIYGIDLQHNTNGIQRLASCGADNNIRIWSLSKDQNNVHSVLFLATLARHQKAVNVVRFSPNCDILASGGDDSCVILWKLSESSCSRNVFEDEDDSQEKWDVLKVFRSHLDGVYDVSWSSDGQKLVSGSMDNTAILWDITKGCKLQMFTDHKNFVQGISYDPLNRFIVTLSSDRSMKVYQISNSSLCYDVKKLQASLKPSKMFHDDSMRSFFRRLSFSPDGKLLVVPSGCLPTNAHSLTQNDSELLSATYIFLRNNLSKPIAYLPLPPSCKTSIAVRFCPVLFKLWDTDSLEGSTKTTAVQQAPLLMSYRMIFAVITNNSVIIYDTQQLVPLAFINNIHYHTLSDLSWTENGDMLVISSTDGYCTIVSFENGEFGEVLRESQPVKSNMEFPTKSIDLSEIKESQQEPARDNEKKLDSHLCTQVKQPRRVTVTTLPLC